MPALRLRHLARNACVKNIKTITNLGLLPFEKIRPVLMKLGNPDKLRELEIANPQLCGADAEVWRAFIKRDIPGWEKKLYEPQNPEDWYKVYYKLRTENEAQLDRDAEMLKAAMDGLKSERAKHTSRLVDSTTVPRLPRMGGMRVEGGRSRVTTNTSSALTIGSGLKTKALTGKGVLEKARREAREMSLFSARKIVLATPTHKLNDKASQVRNAPQGLLDDHRRLAAPSYANHTSKPPTFTPRQSTAVSKTQTTSTARLTNAEREQRLKALTAGKKRDHTGTPILPSTSSSSSSTTLQGRDSTTLQGRDTTTLGAPPARPHGPPDRETLSGSKILARKAEVDHFIRPKRRRIS